MLNINFMQTGIDDITHSTYYVISYQIYSPPNTATGGAFITDKHFPEDYSYRQAVNNRHAWWEI